MQFTVLVVKHVPSELMLWPAVIGKHFSEEQEDPLLLLLFYVESEYFLSFADDYQESNY